MQPGKPGTDLNREARAASRATHGYVDHGTGSCHRERRRWFFQRESNQHAGSQCASRMSLAAQKAVPERRTWRWLFEFLGNAWTSELHQLQVRPVKAVYGHGVKACK